jgi:predicted permease
MTERTLGQLVADATSDVQEIVRAEIALAKAELKQDARRGGVAAGMFGAAGYLGLLASIILTIAAGYGLTEAGLAPWLAFLLLGVALIVVAAILVLVGRSQISKLGPPERAIRSTKLSIAAIKPGASRGR